MRTLDLELFACIVINAFIGIYGTFGTYIPLFVGPYNWRICPNGEYGKARCRPGFKFDCKRGYMCIKQPLFSKFDGLLNGICCKDPSVCPRGHIQGPVCSLKGLCPLGYTCNHGVCCLATTHSVCPPGTIPTSKCTKYYGCQYGAFCLHGTCCSIDKKASLCPLKHYPIPGIHCKHHLQCPDTSLCYGNTCCQSKFRLKRPLKKKTPPIFKKRKTPFIPKQPTVPTRVVVKAPPKIVIPKPKIKKTIIQPPFLPPHLKVTMCPIGYKKVPGLTCSHITACPGTSECISGLCCSKSVREVCPLDHRIIPEVNCNLRQRCPVGSTCISGVCCHPPSCPVGLVPVPSQSCDKGTCVGNNLCISGSCCRAITPPPPTLITDPPLLFDLPKIPPVRAVRKPVLSTKAPIRLTMPPLPDIGRTVPAPRVPQIDKLTRPSPSVPTNNPLISKIIPSIPSSIGTTAHSFVPPTNMRFPDIVDVLFRNVTVTIPNHLVNAELPSSKVGIPNRPTERPNIFPAFPPSQPTFSAETQAITHLNPVPIQPAIPSNIEVGITNSPIQIPNIGPVFSSKTPILSIGTPKYHNVVPPQPSNPPTSNARLPSNPTLIPNVTPILPTKQPIFNIGTPKKPPPILKTFPVLPTTPPIPDVGRPNNPIPNPKAVPILPSVGLIVPPIASNPASKFPVEFVHPARTTSSPFIPPSVTRFPDIIDILLRNVSVANPQNLVNINPPISNINIPLDTVPNRNAVPILPVDVAVPPVVRNVIQNNPTGTVFNNLPPLGPDIQVNVRDFQVPKTSIDVQPLVPEVPIQPGLVQIPSLTDNILNPSIDPLIPGSVPLIPNLSTNKTPAAPVIPDLNLPTLPPILTNIPSEPIIPLDPVLPPTDIQTLTSLTQQPIIPTLPTVPPVTLPNIFNVTPFVPDLSVLNNFNTTITPPTLFTVPPVLPFEPIGNLSTNTIMPPFPTIFPTFPPAAPTTQLPVSSFSKTTTLPPIGLTVFPPTVPKDTVPPTLPPIFPVPPSLPPIFPTLTPLAGLIPSNPTSMPNSIQNPSNIPIIINTNRPITHQKTVSNPIPSTLPSIIVPIAPVTMPPPVIGVPSQPSITIPPSLPKIPTSPIVIQPPLTNTTEPNLKPLPIPPIEINPIPIEPLPPVISNIIPRPPPTLDPPSFPNPPIIIPPPPTIDIQTMPPVMTDPMNVPIAPIDIPPPPATVLQNNFMPTNSPPIPSPPPLTFVNNTVGVSTLPPSLFDPTVPSFNFTLSPPLNPLAPIIPPYSAPPAIPSATLAPVIPPAVPSPAGPTFPPLIATLNTSIYTTTTTFPLLNITNPYIHDNSTPSLVQIIDNPPNTPKVTKPVINLPSFNFTIPPFDILNTTLFRNQPTPQTNITYPSIGPDFTTPYVPFIDPFNFTIPPYNDTQTFNTSLPPLNVTFKRVNISPVNFTDPPINITPSIFNDSLYIENFTFPYDNISFSENTSFPWMNFTFSDINVTTTAETKWINSVATTPNNRQNITSPVSSFATTGTFNKPFLETNTTLPPTLWVTLTPTNYSKPPAPYPTNSTGDIPFSLTSKYMFNFTYPPKMETETSTVAETFGNTTKDTSFVTVPTLSPPTKTVPPFIPTSCPAGNITIPGLSCDKIFKCPAGSTCYYGFCCLPYEMVQVPACLVDFVVTDVCPNPPETDQCRYDRDCGPFMTCCLNSCDRRVCRPTVNPKPSKPR